jgi:hypothetical protein
MDPRKHLDLIVRPNMAAMAENPGDLRHAFNAAAAIDALIAHMYWWAVNNAPRQVSGPNIDDGYRHRLSEKSRDLRLTCEVARANKHSKLIRGEPTILAARNVSVREFLWDDYASFDDAQLRSPNQVAIASTDAGGYEVAEAIFHRALAILEREMVALGI